MTITKRITRVTCGCGAYPFCQHATNAVPLTLTPPITDDDLLTTFSDLAVGDTFDFVCDVAHDNSFYATCRKVSLRCYEYSSNTDDFGESRIVRNRIGSIRAKVYHVNMGTVG